MARVSVPVVEVEIESESNPDRLVAGVCATCPLCDAQGEAYGTGPRSVTRAIMVMRDKCEYPERRNFYVEGGS